MATKQTIDSVFETIEDIIYIIIGLLIIATAAFLIFETIITIVHYPGTDNVIRWVVEVLDKLLLLLMVIEILYTVRISFKEHVLRPEPFLIVGLIAAIRRILVISVETTYLPEKFQHNMIEIGILGVLIFIFVICIIYLHKQLRAKSS